MEIVQENFLSMSYDTFGCRVIQKLFDQISFEESLICEINSIYVKKNLKELIFNPNSNHVIQKIIYILPLKQINFITEFYVQNVSIAAGKPRPANFLDRGTSRESLRLQGASETAAENPLGLGKAQFSGRLESRKTRSSKI